MQIVPCCTNDLVIQIQYHRKVLGAFNDIHSISLLRFLRKGALRPGTQVQGPSCFGCGGAGGIGELSGKYIAPIFVCDKEHSRVLFISTDCNNSSRIWTTTNVRYKEFKKVISWFQCNI